MVLGMFYKHIFVCTPTKRVHVHDAFTKTYQGLVLELAKPFHVSIITIW